MYRVAEVHPGDLQALAALVRAYMLETYQEEWSASAGSLGEGLGSRFRALLATAAREAAGFVAWEPAYDLHHCLTGGHVLDLYVSRGHRGRGVAVRLIAAAAAIVQRAGGAFIKGGAVDVGTGARLYARFAPAFGNDYILGGRAFRHLAAQAHLPLKELVRSLPQREWNFEP